MRDILSENRKKEYPVSYRALKARRKKISARRMLHEDRLCCLVVRFPGYRSRDPGFDFRRYQIFREVVDLKRGPLSIVRIIEELLEWKSSGSGARKSRLTAVGIRCADHATPFIRKSW
jgi:hypothetical protein